MLITDKYINDINIFWGCRFCCHVVIITRFCYLRCKLLFFNLVTHYLLITDSFLKTWMFHFLYPNLLPNLLPKSFCHRSRSRRKKSFCLRPKLRPSVHPWLRANILQFWSPELFMSQPPQTTPKGKWGTLALTSGMLY